MNLGGYQKLTLIDYPGHLATTVFTVGCSFRCPFCHNPELVIAPYDTQPSTLEQDFFEFLDKRKGKLDGVCVTGGEPTIQPDIVEFMERIRSMGYLIKLDSNGTRPDVIKKLFDNKLIDYVAMDIKHAPEKYDIATGTKADLERVRLSVELIRNSGVDYEFRTTVVPGIHEERDFITIGEWLKGSKRYYLQEFMTGKLIDPSIAENKFSKKPDLDKIKKNIESFFEHVSVRRYH